MRPLRKKSRNDTTREMLRKKNLQRHKARDRYAKKFRNDTERETATQINLATTQRVRRSARKASQRHNLVRPLRKKSLSTT